jgi:hypothetical protein
MSHQHPTYNVLLRIPNHSRGILIPKYSEIFLIFSGSIGFPCAGRGEGEWKGEGEREGEQEGKGGLCHQTLNDIVHRNRKKKS